MIVHPTVVELGSKESFCRKLKRYLLVFDHPIYPNHADLEVTVTVRVEERIVGDGGWLTDEWKLVDIGRLHFKDQINFMRVDAILSRTLPEEKIQNYAYLLWWKGEIDVDAPGGLYAKHFFDDWNTHKMREEAESGRVDQAKEVMVS